jgi:UDP-N-acetylmuramate--alanine ligase
MELNHIHTMYFIGIGGIGMSALARYFHKRGIHIHGYDRTATPLTKTLEEEGMHIHYEEDLSQIPDQLDIVVFTPAIPSSHQELQFLRQQDVPILKRAEVLGLISRNSQTIAVAGTHGKTTTSSILTHLLHTGGIECTAFLGGIAQNFASNFVDGATDWVVVEADEYDRSFLQLSPQMAAILSMDPDHLDIYGDHEHMMKGGFQAFADRVSEDGFLLVQQSFDHLIQTDLPRATFGIQKGTIRAANIRVVEGYFYFDLIHPGGEIKDLRFTLPGRHNIENALAAIGIGLQLGLKEEAIRKALSTFKGIKRRFERIVEGKVQYIDDYAHHPTELQSAIGAAKELFPDKQITGIFQPHLYSRTRDFQDGFAAALDQLDVPILIEIYPAREEPIPGVSSEMIFEKMKNPRKRLMKKAEVLQALREINLEVLLTLGAGDIDTLIEPIGEWIRKN